MGFIPLTNHDDKIHAYRVLSRRHRLPEEAKPVAVEISIRFERLAPPIIPYSHVRPNAVETKDALVCLAERIFCFTRLYSDVGDPFFKIVVNGEVRFHDKAKRSQAEALGVRRCSNGFYVDRIHLAN